MPPPSPDDDVAHTPDPRQLARQGETDAFSAMSLLIAGVLLWGGVGYALSRWLDNSAFTLVGLLLGMGGGLALVWIRYGRAQ